MELFTISLFLICVILILISMLLVAYIFTNKHNQKMRLKEDDYYENNRNQNDSPLTMTTMYPLALRQRGGRSPVSKLAVALPRPSPFYKNEASALVNTDLTQNIQILSPPLPPLHLANRENKNNINSAGKRPVDQNKDYTPNKTDSPSKIVNVVQDSSLLGGYEDILSPVNGKPPASKSKSKPLSGLRGSKPLVTSLKPLDLVGGMRRTSSRSPPATVLSTVLESDTTNTATGTPPESATTPTTSSTASMPSISLEDLHLSHVLGGGSFGQVWQGYWKGTPVAVKILSHVNQVAIPTDVVSAFESEVAMLASLRHPNICLYMGACLALPNRAIITELVSRGSLWNVLRTPGLFPSHSAPPCLPWWVSKRVIEDTCRGLIYLHSLSPPVIHRDLKSANLLLDDSYHVKICDFGLARLRSLDTSTGGDSSGLCNVMTAQVGTLQWMAPEVLAGVGYGESADVYSLGLVIWETVTGLCPFDGIGPVQLAGLVAAGSRPEIPKYMPYPLTSLIQRCWAVEPVHRPTAEQVLMEVSSYPSDLLFPTASFSR